MGRLDDRDAVHTAIDLGSHLTFYGWYLVIEKRPATLTNGLMRSRPANATPSPTAPISNSDRFVSKPKIFGERKPDRVEQVTLAELRWRSGGVFGGNGCHQGVEEVSGWQQRP